MSAGDPRGGGGGGARLGGPDPRGREGRGSRGHPPSTPDSRAVPVDPCPGSGLPPLCVPLLGSVPPPPLARGSRSGLPPAPRDAGGSRSCPSRLRGAETPTGLETRGDGDGRGDPPPALPPLPNYSAGAGVGEIGGRSMPRAQPQGARVDRHPPPPPRPGPPLPGPCPPPPPRPLAAELANAHPPHARAATGCGHRPQPLCPPVSPADPSPCGPRGTCEPPQRGSGCWRGSQRQGPPGAGRSWGAVARASPPAHEGPAALLVPDALACHRLSSSPRQAGGAGRSRPAAAAALSTFLAAGGLFSLPGAPAPGQVFTEQPALLWALPRQHRTGVPLPVPSAPRRVSGMGSAPRAPYPLPWPWHPGQCPVPWRRVHSCASVWLPPFLGMLLQGYFE